MNSKNIEAAAAAIPPDVLAAARGEFAMHAELNDETDAALRAALAVARAADAQKIAELEQQVAEWKFLAETAALLEKADAEQKRISEKFGLDAALAVARLSMGEVERDAARYRWLRADAQNFCITQDIGRGDVIDVSLDVLDRQIDSLINAARASMQEKPE